MIIIFRAKRTTSRRNVLNSVGSILLAAGLLPGVSAEKTTGGEVFVTIDEECSRASIKMHPPSSETWSGVIEYLEDDGEVVQIPGCGETVSGGSTANIQVSLSSPGAFIHRAYVVEGPTLEGPAVAEKTCGETDTESGAESGGECDDVFNAEPSSTDEYRESDSRAESIVREVKKRVNSELRD